MLVQLPIGLWTSTCVLDLIGHGKTKAARTLVGLGVFTALPAVASGVSDWVDTDEAEARVGLVHATTNSMAVVCFLGLMVAAPRGPAQRCLLVDARFHLGYRGGFSWRASVLFVGRRSGHQCLPKRTRRVVSRARQRADRRSCRPHRRGRPGDGGPEREGSIRPGRPLQPPGWPPLRGDARRRLCDVPLAWEPVRARHRCSHSGPRIHSSARLRESCRGGQARATASRTASAPSPSRMTAQSSTPVRPDGARVRGQ